jgi:hypothetical protein
MTTRSQFREAEEPDWRFIFEGLETRDTTQQQIDSREPRNREQIDTEADTSRQIDSRDTTYEATNSRATVSEEDTSHEQIGHEEVADLQEETYKICLNCSRMRPYSYELSYDIDSCLGFAKSLGFARQGLHLNLFPSFQSNIQTNLHLYTTAYHDKGQGEREINVKLHKVPHYCLGRLYGHEDINVYIFFPRMYDPNKPTNFPGKAAMQDANLLQIWTDSILLPALFKSTPATTRQHYPTSWANAEQRARAKYREGIASNEADNNTTRQLSLSFQINPRFLKKIWTDVTRRLRRRENKIFRGAQLFFSSKNTKTRFGNATLKDLWDDFNSLLLATLDFTYLDRDRVWIDLSKEVCGGNYSQSSERLGAGRPPSPAGLPYQKQPTCYLYRTCCQESLAQWALLGEKKSSRKATFYPISMLRDAANLTMEMSRISLKRQAGWVFSQTYNSVKEIYDYAKTKPFGNRFLERLAWDSEIAKMIRQQGKHFTVTPQQATKSYVESKTRLFDAFKEARHMSYGTREEHRISLTFFNQVIDHLQATHDWDDDPPFDARLFTYTWVLPAHDYIDYLLLNTNKFLLAIEWILAHEEPDRISYEHCKVVTMLLLALPFAFDSGPAKRPAEIWQTKFERRKGGKVVLGMGLNETLQRSGYARFLPRIDWKTLEFLPEIAHDISLSSSILRDSYRKNWAGVKHAKDDLSRLECAGTWLRLYRKTELEGFVIGFILVLLMRSYRKEVFSHLKPYILPTSAEQAANGDLMLCYSILKEHCPTLFTDDNSVSIVNVRRSKFKSPWLIASFIWGFDDQQRRDRWENAPFRVLYKRAVELINDHGYLYDKTEFHKITLLYFLITHWLFPYPSSTKFVQTTHERRIMWTGTWSNKMYAAPLVSDQTYTLNRPLNGREQLWPNRPLGGRDRLKSLQEVIRRTGTWRSLYPESRPYQECNPSDLVGQYISFNESVAAISITLEEMFKVWKELNQVPSEGEE